MYGDYEEDHPTIVRSYEERWERHIIDTVPLFSNPDPWRIFLVEQGMNARLIYRQHSANSIYETSLRYGEFDNVMHDAWLQLNECHDRELALASA